MRIALATVGTRPVALAGFSRSRLADAMLATVAYQDARAMARTLAVAVGGEDGIGWSVTLLERASSEG